MARTFNQWLDTFLAEKGIDLDAPITVDGDSGQNHMTVENVVDAIKVTTPAEQEKIKTVIVRIDYHNGDVLHFFRHLAKAIAI